MDTEDFVDAIREDNRTALSRLGSSKALYALTEGEMEPDAVRRAAVTLADDAAATFEGWEGEVYADAAAAAAEHRDAIADGVEAGDSSAVIDAVAGVEPGAGRLGALVGWTLVLEKVTEQCTGFFTGQADPGTASTFREYAGTLADLRADALDALADDDEDDDRETAQAAATDVIQAAYEEYVETLEDMGVNPKPVC